MKLLDRFASIDRKFAWSFLGFVLAVFFGCLTIYNEFLKVRDPQLVVEVLGNANVLDLRENLPELKILYGDVDIRSVGKDLSVIVFRLRNVGGAPILVGSYDANAPLRVGLSNGEFLKFELTDATSDYLMSAATAQKISTSAIQLPTVILEPGESYTIKALAIHESRVAPTLKASGKIAGMRDIQVVKLEPEKDNETFFSKVFSGSLGVQFVRAHLYFIVVIIVWASIISSFVGISSAIVTRGRRKAVSQFRKHVNEKVPSDFEGIFDTYIDLGLPPLVHARELVADVERLGRVLSASEGRKFFIPNSGSAQIYPDFVPERFTDDTVVFGRARGARIIQQAKIVSIDSEGKVSVNAEKESLLGRFIDFVTIKNS